MKHTGYAVFCVVNANEARKAANEIRMLIALKKAQGAHVSERLMMNLKTLEESARSWLGQGRMNKGKML